MAIVVRNRADTATFDEHVQSIESGEKSPFSFSLHQRLLLLTTIALLPALVILVVGQLSYRATRTAELESYASQMADVVLTEVIRGMTGAATMMVAAGRAPILDPNHRDACEQYLTGLMHDFPSVVDMAIAGPDGQLICWRGASSSAVLQSAVQDMAAKKPAGLVVGNYRPTSAGAALPIGMVLTADDGRVQGYVELSAAVADLQKLVIGANIPSSSTTVLTDSQGTVLLSVPADLAKVGDKAPGAFRPYLFAQGRGTAHAPDANGTPSIIGYRPSVEQFPLAVVFTMPEATMMAPVNRDAIVFTAIAFLGAIGAFAAAWFIGSRFINDPVRAVYNAITARRAGDRMARTGMRHDQSELGVIAAATDALFDELNAREDRQQRAEEQRDLYAREVQHRVKNLLAIIQVVARQTLSREQAVPEVKAFEGRIDAIVRANAKLLAENESSGELSELVMRSIAPFRRDEHQFQVSGPDLSLRAKPALAIAMALHELCTNAAKYGALSVPEGRVEIQWRVAEERFSFSWIERKGPRVFPPSRAGFGSLLITRALEGETRGTVRVTYATEGLEFVLEAPTDQLLT